MKTIPKLLLNINKYEGCIYDTFMSWLLGIMPTWYIFSLPLLQYILYE